MELEGTTLIIVVSVAVVLVIALVAIAVYVFLRYRRKHKPAKVATSALPRRQLNTVSPSSSYRDQISYETPPRATRDSSSGYPSPSPLPLAYRESSRSPNRSPVRASNSSRSDGEPPVIVLDLSPTQKTSPARNTTKVPHRQLKNMEREYYDILRSELRGSQHTSPQYGGSGGSMR